MHQQQHVSLWLSVDEAELATGFSYGRCVNDGHQLFHVLYEHSEVQSFVSVLKMTIAVIPNIVYYMHHMNVSAAMQH